MSCKAAVKGNHRMSPAEADHLIDQLLELDNPYACPHGRPTIIAMSKYELEKKFKRIVRCVFAKNSIWEPEEEENKR